MTKDSNLNSYTIIKKIILKSCLTKVFSTVNVSCSRYTLSYNLNFYTYHKQNVVSVMTNLLQVSGRDKFFFCRLKIFGFVFPVREKQLYETYSLTFYRHKQNTQIS